MSSDVLHPPNFQSLGQDVIACVLQRARTRKHSFVSATNKNTMVPRNSVFPCAHKFDPVTDVEPIRVVNPTTHTRKVLGRPSRFRVDLSTNKRQDLVEAIHRERHRKSQERYRLRQKALMENLHKCNGKLRDEIQYLRTRRNKLFIGNAPHITMHDVVTEYFRVFRRGFIEPDGSRVAELDFLRLCMAPDLDAGTMSGFEALARTWGVFSHLFGDVRFQCEQVQQITENSLVARTTTSFTFSKRSVDEVFLCNGFRGRPANQKRLTRIAGKLLGEQLVVSGTVRFSWDNSTKRMVGLISHADMLSPLLKLLGNVEDISILFSNASMTVECNLLEDCFSRYPLYH